MQPNFKDFYYTSVQFEEDSLNRVYMYTTGKQFKVGAKVIDNRTKTFGKVIKSIYAYTTDSDKMDEKLSEMISDIENGNITIAVSNVEALVITSALSVYIALGTEYEKDDVLTAAEIVTDISWQIHKTKGRNFKLVFDANKNIVLRCALRYALTYYEIYDSIEAVQEVAKILKELKDYKGYQEAQEYLLKSIL